MMKELKMNKNPPKVMRRNRRFKIFLIWLAEVDILVLLKVLMSKTIETQLVIEIVKYATIIAVVAITGLSGCHMAYDWVNGRRGKKQVAPLPEPSEEEEKTQ